MKEWVTNYMILLLSENENKLAEILGTLSILQCVTLILVGALMITVQDIQAKLRRLMLKIGDYNEQD